MFIKQESCARSGDGRVSHQGFFGVKPLRSHIRHTISCFTNGARRERAELFASDREFFGLAES